jgi:glycosyltransferase involved in cell wall biosynthesis
MVAKKPILATNSYSIPEVLGFDYPGLFSSGDIELLSSKMYQALSDINYSNSLVSCYDYQLKKFESANMATNILKIYDKVGF